ncbi:MAG: hypothetical protein ACHP78_19645, partial [Terriglobales bacterium]
GFGFDSFTGSLFAHSLALQACRQERLHSVQSIDVDLLLLINDPIGAKRPPFTGSEIGGNLGLWSAAPKPLDQVQIS